MSKQPSPVKFKIISHLKAHGGKTRHQISTELELRSGTIYWAIDTLHNVDKLIYIDRYEEISPGIFKPVYEAGSFPDCPLPVRAVPASTEGPGKSPGFYRMFGIHSKWVEREGKHHPCFHVRHKGHKVAKCDNPAIFHITSKEPMIIMVNGVEFVQKEN